MFGTRPNIIGWIGDIPMGTNSGSNVYGALFQGEQWTTADILQGQYAGYWTLQFNASSSNSTYKDGTTTVQPPALSALPCIRY